MMLTCLVADSRKEAAGREKKGGGGEGMESVSEESVRKEPESGERPPRVGVEDLLDDGDAADDDDDDDDDGDGDGDGDDDGVHACRNDARKVTRKVDLHQGMERGLSELSKHFQSSKSVRAKILHKVTRPPASRNCHSSRRPFENNVQHSRTQPTSRAAAPEKHARQLPAQGHQTCERANVRNRVG
eukprot:1754350-Rhodomonas_salina.2